MDRSFGRHKDKNISLLKGRNEKVGDFFTERESHQGRQLDHHSPETSI